MKLKTLYQEIVKKGIDADVRSRKEIETLLCKSQKKFDKLDKKDKELFDQDSLFNPFADTRILIGEPDSSIKSIIVGIDIDGGELVLVDRLIEKGKKIDLVVSHHPQGRAYANFYDVMDLQIDVFAKEGIALGVCEKLLEERKSQVARRVSAANHSRSVDIAGLLNINFICAHTPCDNLAYQYLRKVIDKNKPKTLGVITDILQTIPEYFDAAKNNNPPQIVGGSKNSRCKNIHLEFTGGTEGPKGIYKELASKGVDTIIAMHQSEEHFKKCKEAKINVIFASHIASDSLGINIMLDYLEDKEKLKIYEFSGFRRFKRKKS
ncbi:MAG: NGG1p interacting factor NIF3 [Candidatus Omnitrophica bacterium]|nr:NGG1p interacting factor NIF3 [Candidatus Omnitrophota bacterium]